MIEAQDLSVSLSRRPIVRGVSLQARPGELLAIIGPNGSGKTTLMKAISGELAYGGRLAIGGRELSGLKPWELATLRAVLPQSATLSFPFTVREVVALGLSAGVTGLSPEVTRTLPERALERVDLAGFAGRFYGHLSGGEQQRVQFARVLCQVWRPVVDGRPRFLMLDEPVSSLDIRHQLIIMNIARDFARAGGGVIAVLHDLNLAAMYADRICLMQDGRVAALGSPAEVIRDELIAGVFGCRFRVGATPPGGSVFVLPQTIEDFGVQVGGRAADAA